MTVRRSRRCTRPCSSAFFAAPMASRSTSALSPGACWSSGERSSAACALPATTKSSRNPRGAVNRFILLRYDSGRCWQNNMRRGRCLPPLFGKFYEVLTGMGDHKMNRRNVLLAVIATAAALLLLAGCGTYQDIYGNQQQQQPYTNTIHGTVDYVDTASHSIVLYDTSGYGTMLSGTGYPANGGSVRVYYDNRTGVSWQGRGYRPEGLDRGDQRGGSGDQWGTH